MLSYSMCGSGSTKLLKMDPVRIRIHNTVNHATIFFLDVCKFDVSYQHCDSTPPPFLEKDRNFLSTFNLRKYVSLFYSRFLGGNYFNNLSKFILEKSLLKLTSKMLDKFKIMSLQSAIYIMVY